MKFKALRTKKEPKEFVTIECINEEYFLLTHELPNPMPMTATMENLKKYFEEYSPLPENINFNDFELATFEISEIN